MPLADLAQAAPGVVLLGLAPGLLLATLIAPSWRWWERLAAAPGLSAGLVGVTGLLMHDTHVPFEPATVLPVFVVLAAATVWRMRRASATGAARAASPSREVAIIVGAALGAGLLSAALLVAGMRGELLPVENDPSVHGTAATAIAQRHDALPLISTPVEHSGWVRPRSGFEDVAALVSQVGGPPAASAMLPFALAAVLLLPLGLAAIALEASGSAAVAALAAVLGVGLPMPSVPLTFGEFPLVVDSTLVAPLVLGSVRALRAQRPREAIVMVGATAAGIWVIHGLEAATALAIAGPWILALLADRATRTQHLRRLAAVAVAAGAGAALVTVLTRLPSIPAVVSDPLSGPFVASSSQFLGTTPGIGFGGFLRATADYVLPSPVLLVPYALGVAATLLTRRMRWVVVAHVLLLAALADVTLTGKLHRLWVALFPWSDNDRLASIQYWVVPLLMAVGVFFAVDVLKGAAAAQRGSRRRVVAVAVVAPALVSLVAGARHDSDVYRVAVHNGATVTAADLRVTGLMSDLLPAGAAVLTDGTDDAGQWLGALTPQDPFFSKDYLNSHPDDRRIVALQHACDDPGATRRVVGGFSAVYVGGRRRSDAGHPWTLRCVAALPWLRPLAVVGVGNEQAGLFAVVP